MNDDAVINPNEPPPGLSREDLWRRNVLAVEALRLVQDRGCTEWNLELIETLIGCEDGHKPMDRGSLDDAATAPTDPNIPKETVDRQSCIYQRGHLFIQAARTSLPELEHDGPPSDIPLLSDDELRRTLSARDGRSLLEAATDTNAANLAALLSDQGFEQTGRRTIAHPTSGVQVAVSLTSYRITFWSPAASNALGVINLPADATYGLVEHVTLAMHTTPPPGHHTN